MKRMLIFFFVILALCLVGTSASVYYIFSCCSSNPQQWIEAFFSQARIPMFTGFLTLGSFLLTLQTAIIQRLKEAYDSSDYARKFKKLHSKDTKVKYYGSLERVGVALSSNVVLSLLTAVLQMSLGFVKSCWSASICIGFAATTISLVIYLTVQLVMAHHQWFKKIEEEKNGI